MPWFNVDDGFAFHHKAVKAGNAAIGLWTRAGSWCAQQLTDGYVPAEMVDVFGTPAQARRLVAAGLWHTVEGGYRFHQWTENGRNPTRKEVEKKRQAESDRKARWREEKAAKSANQQVNGDSPNGTGASVPPSVPPSVRSSTPLHSTPLKEEKKTSSSSRPRTRGTRIPDDFAVSAAMVAWARDRVPTVDGRHETEKFINYWQSASGQKAVKRDWEATWRNWMLTAAERTPTARGTNGHPSRPSTTDQRVADAQALKARFATNGSVVLQLPTGENR